MTPTSAFKPRGVRKNHLFQAGFTLLEILLVLTLIGMASVLVVPNITNLESRNFAAQIRQATSLLNYARRTSVVSGQPAIAAFIVNAESDSDDEIINHMQLGNVVGEWYGDGASIVFVDSTNRELEIEDSLDIEFYPEGGSTGGTLLISLQDESIAIQIDPFTGRISTLVEDN